MTLKRNVIRLSNNFHNSDVFVHAKQIGENKYHLSTYQMKKVWKMLCGSKECTCGNAIGVRGMHVEIIPDLYGCTIEFKEEKY